MGCVNETARLGRIAVRWRVALVRPAKAGLFSGRKSRRGKSQKPRSLEDRRRETDDLKLFDKAVPRDGERVGRP